MSFSSQPLIKVVSFNLISSKSERVRNEVQNVLHKIEQITQSLYLQQKEQH